MRRVFVDPGAPQRDAIEEAAKWIVGGGRVVIPIGDAYAVASRTFPDEVADAPRISATHDVGRAIVRESGSAVACEVIPAGAPDTIEDRFADRVDLLIDVGVLGGGAAMMMRYVWLQDERDGRA